ncbi:MAG: cation:proton antiporter [Deltaproteobacteria bacterium]|nr:cation:proton antiporter [Deltaproteobacteria bacterium]
MDKHIIIGLAAVLLLGLFAQWVAWRYRFPSILLLLIVGFVAGPISGFLDPNLLFGDLLFPIVSICVAIILFEGGLNLQFKELGNVGTIVLRLVTVGVLVTAIFGTVAARAFLGLDLELALLLGAILTVSGPTVILPLLRHIRPKAPLNEILKWEGILIDPVGALLAVIIFEAIIARGTASTSMHIVTGVFQAVFVGTVTGTLGAFFMGTVLKKHLLTWIFTNPSHTWNCSRIFLRFYSTHFILESGLVSFHVNSIALANMKEVSVQHLLEFNEDLRVLIISLLFIGFSEITLVSLISTY